VCSFDITPTDTLVVIDSETLESGPYNAATPPDSVPINKDKNSHRAGQFAPAR
jgi:hypothetical protein